MVSEVDLSRILQRIISKNMVILAIYGPYVSTKKIFLTLIPHHASRARNYFNLVLTFLVLIILLQERYVKIEKGEN